MTGGALARVNERWPGAFFSTDGGDDGDGDEDEYEAAESVRIRYVAVAGRAVVGDAFAPRGTAARAAAAAYSQVAGGDGHGVAGDGALFLFFLFHFFFRGRGLCLNGKKERKNFCLSLPAVNSSHPFPLKKKKTGVVPLSAATLPGADNVILDGVFHAPRRSSGGGGGGEGGAGAGEGKAPFERATAAAWFGEEAVVDSWLPALVRALEE